MMDSITTKLNDEALVPHISEAHLLMDACLLAGEILMANGSEITRVEDVILRIGRAAGIEKLQVYALFKCDYSQFSNSRLDANAYYSTTHSNHGYGKNRGC